MKKKSGLLSYLSKILKWEAISGICAVIMLIIALVNFIPEKEIVKMKRSIQVNVNTIDSLYTCYLNRDDADDILLNEIEFAHNLSRKYSKIEEDFDIEYLKDKPFEAIVEAYGYWSAFLISYDNDLINVFNNYKYDLFEIDEDEYKELEANPNVVINPDVSFALQCDAALRLRINSRDKHLAIIKNAIEQKDKSKILKEIKDLSLDPDFYKFFHLILNYCSKDILRLEKLIPEWDKKIKDRRVTSVEIYE